MPQIYNCLSFTPIPVQSCTVMRIKEKSGCSTIIICQRTTPSIFIFSSYKFYISGILISEFSFFRDQPDDLIFFIIPGTYKIFIKSFRIICAVHHFPIFKHKPVFLYFSKTHSQLSNDLLLCFCHKTTDIVQEHSEKAQPFRIFFNRTFCHTCLRNLCKIIQMQTFREGYSQKNL